MEPPAPIRTTNAWRFDASGLAEAVSDRRTELGWSTRELARRAGISQAYVVALERVRHDADARTPTPTVDVLARMADALGLSPTALLTAAVRRTGSHVLLVVDDHPSAALPRVRRITGRDGTTWIWAASTAGARVPRTAAYTINLRADPRATYRPDAIAAALDDELQRLSPGVAGTDVGFVFAETSTVMEQIAEPSTIIEFERGWNEVVTSTARRHGARAAWNVCVYRLDALRSLADPVSATLDLMRHHDEVWTSERAATLTGPAAARRALEQLRPAGTPPATWTVEVGRMVDRLHATD